MVKLIFINFIQLEGKEMVGGLLRVDIEKLRKWGVYYRSVEGQMLSAMQGVWKEEVNRYETRSSISRKYLKQNYKKYMEEVLIKMNYRRKKDIVSLFYNKRAKCTRYIRFNII